jgi:hypothetical protein
MRAPIRWNDSGFADENDKVYVVERCLLFNPHLLSTSKFYNYIKTNGLKVMARNETNVGVYNIPLSILTSLTHNFFYLKFKLN